MALWIVRAGKYGEHESRFLEDKRIYLTFGDLTESNLSGKESYEAMRDFMRAKFPDESLRKVGNWTGQVWAFAGAMKIGDWVVMPSKSAPTIAIGEVTSSYSFNPAADGLYRHTRAVRWLNTQVPRTAFDQDLLYSFGSLLSVCEIKRNDAEKRVRAMALHQWQSVPITNNVAVASAPTDTNQAEPIEVDLEELAQDSIAKLIIQKFKGHGMARLVNAVLKAQGFTTYLSPEGPDKGIDILAAGGTFGSERPRICVQVKSSDSPTDRPEFTQLIGAMQSCGAEMGLFVSWGGFKPTVMKEVPSQFFKVRIWNEKDLIEQLLACYDKLDQDMKAELPLKQIWTIATPED